MTLWTECWPTTDDRLACCLEAQPDHSILVAGSGSIGRRHMRNLQTLGCRRISAADPDTSRLEPMVAELGVQPFSDFDEALEHLRPDVVLVCTPPALHVPQALAAVRSGAHVFVEKPLSHSLDGVDELIRETAERDRTLQVGYNWRFDLGVQRVKALVEQGAIGRILWARAESGQYLPDWRPWQDYRLSYTASRSKGGGIILEGSHEIDYMRWIFGEVVQVYCAAGVLSDLQVDAEDTASMILRFASGCIGEIHLDFVQRTPSRGCKVVGTEGTIIWDNTDSSVRVFAAQDGEWERIDVGCDGNDMYLAEMESFLACLDGAQQPIVGAEAARRVLEIAMAARRSACTNGVVELLVAERH